MDQTLDPFFKLDERAVRDQVHDLAANATAHGELGIDVVPRILHALFESEGDALLLQVHIEDGHFDFPPDREHLGRMVDAAPAHIGNMQQAIHPLQIDERAKVGDVLDDALANLADLDFRKQFLLLFAPAVLQQLPAGQDDIATILVDLKDLELELLVQEIVRVANRQDIELGAGQKRVDADIHDHAAFDAALDDTFDEPAFLAGFKDAIPAALLLRLGLAENDHAVIILESFEKDFHVVTDMDLGDIPELGG